LEGWCEDSKNGVVLCGYSVEGTLGEMMVVDEMVIIFISQSSISSHISYLSHREGVVK